MLYLLAWCSTCLDKMREQIPISFDYDGKHYDGYFIPVHGASGKLWHLMVGGYFYGQLFHTDLFGWQFSNNQKLFNELTDYFADVITAWYQ